MKRAIITVIVVAVAVVAAGYVVKKVQAANQPEKIQYKVATIGTGQVKRTVSATGALQPWTFADIKSKAGGMVLKLLVDVGTQVKAGQVIAMIDPTDTRLAYDQARADTESAQAKEEQSERIQTLQVQQSSIAIQNARAALDAAKANLNAAKARLETAQAAYKAQPELTKANIDTAKANEDQAQKARDLLDATNKQNIAAARSALAEAVANKKNAEANLTRQKRLLEKGFVSQQVVDNAQATYDVNAAQVDQMQQKVDTISDELKADVAAADAKVAQAKAQLANAQASAVDVESKKHALAEAQASVKQLKAQVAVSQQVLNQAIADQANNTIKIYDIRTAKASIDRANASLQNATTTLKQTRVTAPNDGIILKKYVDAGTMITSGLSLNSTGTSIVQLGDIRRMYVDVTVDETDIANVDVGQAVDVNMDAYPGVPFEGKVTLINPQADVIQNVTQFHVRVEMNNDVPAYRLLKPGMNATCEFVIDKKPDVLNVPNEAIHTDDNGKYVEIAKGGKPAPADPKSGTPVDPNTLIDVTPVRRPIETGLEGNDATEVTSGLKQGDVVITQTIEPVKQNAGSPFGGGGPGGRMGGFGGGRGR